MSRLTFKSCHSDFIITDFLRIFDEKLQPAILFILEGNHGFCIQFGKYKYFAAVVTAKCFVYGIFLKVHSCLLCAETI